MSIALNVKDYFTAAVVLAAGSGSRMGMDLTKQRISICGKSVLRHSLEAFESAELVDTVVIVCREDELDFAKAESIGLKKISKIVIGGNCRAESSKNGFLAIPEEAKFVMFHDAARCLISSDDINSVAKAAYECGAATASQKITDTIKECNSDDTVKRTVQRETLRSVQTPQAFSVSNYKNALGNISALDASITDDNSIVESLGVKIKCVDTDALNIKITRSSDLELAEFILGKRSL